MQHPLKQLTNCDNSCEKRRVYAKQNQKKIKIMLKHNNWQTKVSLVAALDVSEIWQCKQMKCFNRVVVWCCSVFVLTYLKMYLTWRLNCNCNCTKVKDQTNFHNGTENRNSLTHTRTQNCQPNLGHDYICASSIHSRAYFNHIISVGLGTAH